jgi:NAD(P)-dependent dehydrogenase (short-subunit alcohol dehydrogenase family)
MMISLKGLTAFVTGASRGENFNNNRFHCLNTSEFHNHQGIGRAIAVRFAQEGCNLFLLGRDSSVRPDFVTQRLVQHHRSLNCF